MSKPIKIQPTSTATNYDQVLPEQEMAVRECPFCEWSHVGTSTEVIVVLLNHITDVIKPVKGEFKDE